MLMLYLNRKIFGVKELKDRLILLILLMSLWGFLYFFQYLVPVNSKLALLFCFMVAYTFFVNAAFKHQRRKNKKNPPVLDYDYKPFVSILIPSHNEELVIRHTIENILKIDYDDFEVIVIDDRSTDKTPEVIKALEVEFAGKVKAVIRDKDAFPGKSAVLNDVVPITKGEVLCVFDADARVKPHFLKELLPYLSPKDVGAVQARKIISNKNDNILTRCQNNEYTLDTHFQLSRDSIKGAVELRGNGQLIKKEAILDVEGWNIHTITDDLDLSTKLHIKGWDIRYCIAAEVYEEGILSLWPLVRQRRRWVEGSIRRYLDYFLDVLTSKKISLRVTCDMWCYISEFVMPVWLLFEWIIQTCKFVKGDNTDFSYAFIILISFSFFFISGLVYSLRKYDKLPIFECLKQAVETGIYLISIWTPVVTFIVLKIIFTKRTLDWGKTAHGASAVQELEPVK